ncbi:hypothetical protein F5B22DRAFT_651489 [Xylaria bambusicola]|uniref:uncharacterized protein n=1 Tax=Xylaria bambusicola TaxID=326684 RepID=UPI0020075E2E|nr:uncharacterized protein F5B22DRAFT_651489 [Xylaria bambusicola]KAI0505691.1 hypothetical protein F5B22DRAFT_651489 [Xylaria bambusicola]
MGTVNDSADVLDILRDSKFVTARDRDPGRPDSGKLVTPTVETRRDLPVRYRDDYIYIMTRSTSAASTPLAPHQVAKARDNVKSLIETATTNSKAKQLRLEAYRLKLSRAMYTLGLFSGKPEASKAEIKAGLKARLEDWILYELAWNASEMVNLERVGVSDELKKKIIENVKTREYNIEKWREMWDEVDDDESDKDKDGDEAEDKEGEEGYEDEEGYEKEEE